MSEPCVSHQPARQLAMKRDKLTLQQNHFPTLCVCLFSPILFVSETSSPLLFLCFLSLVNYHHRQISLLSDNELNRNSISPLCLSFQNKRLTFFLLFLRHIKATHRKVSEKLQQTGAIINVIKLNEGPIKGLVTTKF